MLLRLILALIVLTLAVPAAEMSGCHQPATPGSAQAGHGTAHRDTVPDQHHVDAECIGCVAPATIGKPWIEAPVASKRGAPIVIATPGAPRDRDCPVPPPPRSA